MNTRLAEAERQAGDLVRFGIIAEVDLDAGRVVVTIGEITSPPLPWLCPRASAEAAEGDDATDVVWDPPAVGEQVMVLSADADLAAGLVLAGVPSDSVLDQLGDARGRAVYFRRFRDGSTILHDPEAKELTVAMAEEGKAKLTAQHFTLELAEDGVAKFTAPGGFDFVGDMKLTGKLEVSEDVTVAKDVKAAGVVKADKDVVAKTVSLVDHVHLGVSTGPGLTQKPKP